MNGARSAFAYAVDQFTQGLGSGNPQARLEPFNDWERVGRELPKKARILYHNRISMTGLQHVTLSDEPGVQYGLSYGRFPSMKAMHARLVEMGVSHLSWMDENGPPDSVAGELRFRAFPPYLIRAFATYEREQARRGLRPSGPLVTNEMLDRLEVVEIGRARAEIR